MVTEPFRNFLDPDFSRASARELIELVSPLLHEVVNHASWAFQRCQTEESTRAGLDRDAAPLILYRHVIEFSDSIEVLLSNVCIVPSIPLLRSSFEASLSLEYIMSADYARRSLSWLCEYVHRRIQIYQLIDQSTQAGREFARAWVQEYNIPAPSHPNVTTTIANLQAFLSKSHMVTIEVEYQNQRSNYPNWFSLFGGPRDLRSLAISLNHQTEYDYLYRYWSSVAHAGSLADYLTKSSDGNPSFTCIRYPESFKENAVLTVTLLLRSTRLMISHFRPGENISRWYSAEVKPRLDHLESLNITMEAQEH